MEPLDASEPPRWATPRDLVLSLLFTAFLLAGLGVLAELANRPPAGQAAGARATAPRSQPRSRSLFDDPPAPAVRLVAFHP